MARTGDIAVVLFLLLLVSGSRTSSASSTQPTVTTPLPNAGDWVWPLPKLFGTRRPVVSSGWGSDRGDHLHVGADIMYKRARPLDGPVLLPLPDHGSRDHELPEGTQVLAAGPGTVVDVATTGKGTHVVIDHGKGFKTFYQHLTGSYVEDGDRVYAGEPIGEAGYSHEDHEMIRHLHFEMWFNGDPFNPAPLLSTFRTVED